MSEAHFSATFPRETDVVEFKAGVSGKQIQDAVVAFSNSRGGVVLIGVDDRGRVTGRELTQSVEESLHQAIAETRNPSRYSLHRLVVDTRPVTILSVARRVEGFAQTSSGRILVRRGPRNEPLFDADLLRFISERALERFELRDSGVSVDAIDENLLVELAEAFDWSDPTSRFDRLEEERFAVRQGRRKSLTIAGALYLLRQPAERLGKTFIELLRYPEGGSDYDKRISVTGPLHHQVVRATHEVMSELGTELVVLGLQRHELPRIPYVVLREAIANAVAHRAYEASGSAVRVEIRPDAVKIVSPGPLPVPVTVANIREAQAARNLTVIRALRRFRLAEDVGRGVDVMQDSMRNALLDPPVFRDTGHAVEVTLPVRSAVTSRERAWVFEVERRGHIEPADRILLVHAARGEVLTNKRARELLGVDRVDARRALQRLRRAGFLVQHGERGGAAYTLVDTLAPPAGLRLDPKELEQVVLGMAAEGPLTNARVRAVTGLDRLEVLRLLNRLVSRGELERVGERRGARYVVADPGRRSVSGRT